MKFLGSCEVCGKVFKTYRSFSQHLRHLKDSEHRELKQRYREWKDSYQAMLRCRKCGSTWTIEDRKRRNEKICPSCRKLKKEIGKRRYEKLKFQCPPDPRPQTTTRTRWRGVPSRILCALDGPLYGEVLRLMEERGLKGTMAELSLPEREVRRVCLSAWGKEGYAFRMKETRENNVLRAAETRRAFCLERLED